MRHEISKAEANRIHRARAPQSVERMDSIALADAAARGNVAAKIRLQFLRDQDAAESRAKVQ